ncbi:MAG: DNA alkylation repair protein, partial [Phycisphaeraceae bacterium]|nr:DNA alkylation repair protein [Phycisphaeraceae bacterium]
YDLPDRPWGTAADDVFYSLEAGEYAPGKRFDVSRETIRNGAHRAILERLKNRDVSEETLLGYALHIDQGVRGSAMGQIKRRGLHHLTKKLLKSDDPRGRHAGLLAVDKLPDATSDEVIGLLTAMIEDPDESWWVVMAALNHLQHASADQLAPHIDTIEKWMAHDDWWLKARAVQAATPLAVDKRFHERLLPKIAQIMATNQRPGLNGALRNVAEQAKKADEQVAAFAREQFATAYANYPEVISAPGSQDMTAGTEYMLRSVAHTVAATPGGLDALYDVAKKRFPDVSLPHKELYLQADPKRLGPELQVSMKKIILEDLIPEYIGTGHHPQSNRGYLMNEATSAEPLDWGFYYREPRMAGLVKLYQRAGIDEYNWRDAGPKWNEMSWHYFNFDPPEKKAPGTGTRYREITIPKGMEDWFKPGFNPVVAGWKKGKQPFGQRDGKLVDRLRGCRYDFCRCDTPMQTLWKDEVMLLNGKFKFPTFKEGHRYRLLVGGMSHVRGGDGYRVYVEGKKMFERDRGVGRREGAQPMAYYIDKAWWADFAKDKTTLAAISFLRIEQNHTNRHFSIWLQEMKVPPMGRDEIIGSAT